MEDKIKIEKNTVQETLVIPLLSRKICTDIYGDFFTDSEAVKLIDRLDYDFGDVKKKSKNIVERFGALEVAVRQKACIYEVKEYLKKHPYASVVNMGCGLDQSVEVCDNGTCKMYNVDFPDIIDIRNKIIPEKDRVTNIPADLNDPSWYEKISRDNGAVFFAPGVFYYFSKNQMEKMINGMAEYFHGGKVVFDIGGKAAVKAAIKAWVKKQGIKDVNVSFYVNKVETDIKPWLKKARVSAKPYMYGYFDLREKSISSLFRFIARITDVVMKMIIVRIDFDE